MVATDQPALGQESKPRDRYSRSFQGVKRFIRNKPLGAVGGAIVLLLLLLGLFASFITPYSYDDFSVPDRLLSPSSDHFFGTDEQGRDVFSRVLYGARTSVIIGFGAVAISILVATIIGTVSGYYGGLLDLLLQRVIDVWLAFPGLVFVIFVIAVFSRSTPALVLTLGVMIAAGSSRIVRSATIAVKEAQYVEASRASGASHTRILLRHILPNVIPVIIITASVQVGSVILIESSLSYLGFGVPPPFPSWGRMLQESQTNMIYNPTLAIFPGLAITIVVYGFNMFGDALRDVLDPRLRGSK